MSEAIYRYLGREPSYQPTKLSIVGGSRPQRFLELSGLNELDFDEPIYVVGGDLPGDLSGDDRPDQASNDLRELFGGDNESISPDNDCDPEIPGSCPDFSQKDATSDPDDNEDIAAGLVVMEEEPTGGYDITELFI